MTTTKPKKPKAWRALLVNSGDPKVRCAQEYPGARKHYDCTVVPDGADHPLPPEVRRLVRIGKLAVAWGDGRPNSWEPFVRAVLKEAALRKRRKAK